MSTYAPLWQRLENACAKNKNNPGVPDMMPSDWAIAFDLLADEIERRCNDGDDLDQIETADWLRLEAGVARTT